MQTQEVFDLLKKYSIPLNTWGTGDSKTIDHLLTEIKKRESSLLEEAGKLLRVERGVAINIFYHHDSINQKLVEDRQVFKAAASAAANYPLVSEKK